MVERDIRRFPLSVRTDLVPGVEYGIAALRRSGIADIKTEVAESDDETTQVYLIPTSENDEMQASWLKKMFNRTPRPPEELKADIDDHVSALSTDNIHLRTLHPQHNG